MRCPHCQKEIDLTKTATGFDEWWAAYPRKDSKGDARKAYATACAKVEPGILLKGARAYAELRRGQDKIYTKTPGAWLRAEKWADEELTSPASRLADNPSVQAIPPEQVGIHPSWGSYAVPMVREVGEARFLTWLGRGELRFEAHAATVTVDSSFKRDYILQKLSRDVYKVLGVFEIVVSPS